MVSCGKHSKNDTEISKIDSLNNLAFTLRISHPDFAKNRAKEAISLSEINNYPEGKARAYNNLVCINYFLSDFKNAESNIKSIRELNKLNNYSNEGIENAIADIFEAKMFQRRCEFKEAFNLYDNIKIVGETKLLKPNTWFNFLKKCYYKNNDIYYWARSEYLISRSVFEYFHKQAVTGYSAAINYLKEIDNVSELDTAQKAYIYYTMADTYFDAFCDEKDTENRESYFDSICEYYINMLNILPKMSSKENYTYFLANAYEGLGSLLYKLQDDTLRNVLLENNRIDSLKLLLKEHGYEYDINILDDNLPLQFFLEANIFFTRFGDPYQLTGVNYYIGRFYFNGNEFEKANTYLSKSIEHESSLKYFDANNNTIYTAPSSSRRTYLLASIITESDSLKKSYYDNYSRYNNIILKNEKNDFLSEKQSIEKNIILIIFFACFFAIIFIVIIVFLFQKRRELNKENQYHDAVEKCYDIFIGNYVDEKSLEKIVVEISKILAEKVFLQNNKDFVFAISIQDDRKEKMRVFAYEKGKYDLAEYYLTEENRPGVICYKKNEMLYESNWQKNYAHHGAKKIEEPILGEHFTTIMYYPLINSQKNVFGTISAQSMQEDAFDTNQRESFKYLANFISFSLDIIEERKKELWKKLNRVGKKMTTFQLSENNFEEFVKNTYDDIKKILNKKDDDISFDIYQKIDDNNVMMFSFEKSQKKVNKQPFDITCKDSAPRPAIGCYKETEGKNTNYIFQHFYFPDWHEDYKSYYEIHCPEIKERKEPINKSNDTRSILLFPIRNSKNKNIGIVSLQHLEANAFDETHKLIIEFIANYIGVAIENAELIKINEELILSEQLRYTINNHFVKNILGTFRGKIVADNQKYYDKFIDIYKHLVTAQKDHSVTVSDDIKFLEEYVLLHNFIYFEVKFSHTCDKELLKKNIPPLITQPFIENSIEHGFKDDPRNIPDKKISIEYTMEENVIKCIITDNGQGRAAREEQKYMNTPNPSTRGVSIGSTKKLLETKYHIPSPAVEIDDLVSNGVSAGTKVTIFIPIIETKK
jgi:hypothetical protein